jgi:hypothetical protein
VTERVSIAPWFGWLAYLRAEIDTNHQRNGGNKRRAQLQPPRHVGTSILDSEVGAGTQKDAECGPELPGHDQAATDVCGCILGAEYLLVHMNIYHLGSLFQHTGTVTSLRPIPIPSSTRVAMSSPHFWVVAIPKGARSEKTAATKIVPRRPIQSLKGSEIQAVLFNQ